MSIGLHAILLDKLFSGFLACAIGIWFSLQEIINIGSVIGILPTKGLTLPIIGYGGSSLITVSISIALLLRIDHENKLSELQAIRDEKDE